MDELLRQLDPALREDLHGSQPWVMSPLICACEHLDIREVPAACELGPWRFGGAKKIEENSKLLLPPAERGRKRFSFKDRSKYFANEEHRKAAFFETNHIYSFDFYSQRLDFNNYHANMSVVNLDLAKYCNGQPFQ